jgi:hypothetical protein
MVFHTYRFKTATELHDGLCDSLLFGSADELDDVNSVDVQQHNVMAHAASFDWDYGTERLWTTRARWNTMVKQYVDPEAFEAFLLAMTNRPKSRRGITVFRTNLVKANQTGRGVTRRHGSCMLTLSYRERPFPQITLHSRTCYLGYLSVLDMTVAHVFARWASSITGVDVLDMAFMWQLEMSQFHGFRTIAYPLGGSDELYDEYLEADRGVYPGLNLSRTWHDRLTKLDDDGTPYGDMKFASYARVRKRWHMEVYGREYAKKFEGGTYNTKLGKASRAIPPTPVDTLDFSKIGHPGP